MKNIDFTTALAKAEQLPQDANSPIYQLFDEKVSFTTIYRNDPVSVFESMIGMRRNGAYYVVTKNKIRTLMYHKKYARVDVPVKSVEFNVVGLKRHSTHLSAGVLVSNIKFIV